MKYASRIGRSFPRILNWTGIATPKYIEIQSLFVESNLSLHSILISTLEEREQEYVKCFEFEAQSNDALQDNMNDWKKDEDHEKAEAYTTATVATMKGGKDGDSSKLPSFKIRNPRSEPYNATMGNDMTMNFKSKLGKFETSGKDNKKEASMDDAQNETPVNVFPQSYILYIF
ncbi:hypothetical protein CK203_014468 [Vitis vinifera]|uniref:Uncharacterized protein n=1 Tax=Vitis vinifera TaxID=29760 RepID=A0A438EUW5_VITVI|nr:hypothetical protein CK203_084030 [Vitis vinifera]RVX16326.1 hypothetical protein CK203_014468 [Vitis vinifera]